MKTWIRWLTTTALIAVLAAIAIWVPLLEIVMTAFMPNVMFQLLLPVVVAVLGIVCWQLVRTLYRWAPGAKAAALDDGRTPPAGSL